MGAFTNETKYGYVDGEHIGNWGTEFPIFIRVVNGTVYPVGREEGNNWKDVPTHYMQIFKMSRDWMKLAPCKDYPADADLFADAPNASPDTSVVGSAFIKTGNTSSGLFKRPNVNATATTPVPDATTPADPATTLPATTNAPSTTTQPGLNLSTATSAATAKVAMPVWLKVGVGLAGVGLIVGIAMWWMQRKK